jgi:hypothetical protein
MDENRSEPILTRYLSAIAVGLIIAGGVTSVTYRSYLAKDASDAATSACAEHNTISGAYEICLARFSQIEQNP